jgi:hypothetical protein
MMHFFSFLYFCHFSFGHCIVCTSSFNDFWLPLWYLQTLHYKPFIWCFALSLGSPPLLQKPVPSNCIVKWLTIVVGRHVRIITTICIKWTSLSVFDLQLLITPVVSSTFLSSSISEIHQTQVTYLAPVRIQFVYLICPDIPFKGLVSYKVDLVLLLYTWGV